MEDLDQEVMAEPNRFEGAKTVDFIYRLGVAKVVELMVAPLIVTRLLERFPPMPSPLQHGLGWFVGLLICFWIPPIEFQRIGFARWLWISFAIGLLAVARVHGDWGLTFCEPRWRSLRRQMGVVQLGIEITQVKAS